MTFIQDGCVYITTTITILGPNGTILSATTTTTIATIAKSSADLSIVLKTETGTRTAETGQERTRNALILMVCYIWKDVM